MNIEEAYNQIKKDRITLRDSIAVIFRTGRFHPAFVVEEDYEQFIINIFKYHIMTIYPDKFLVTYVTGKEYKDEVCHAFKSWYTKLTNGNIDHWLSINNLTDADKYVDGEPIKSEEIYHQRYIKALEIKDIPSQDVLYKMMSIIEIKY